MCIKLGTEVHADTLNFGGTAELRYRLAHDELVRMPTPTSFDATELPQNKIVDGLSPSHMYGS
jgi:hypothetical protein